MLTPETPEKQQSDLIWRITELALETLQASTRQQDYAPICEIKHGGFSFYIFKTGSKLNFDDNKGFPVSGPIHYFTDWALQDNAAYSRSVAFINKAITQLKEL